MVRISNFQEMEIWIKSKKVAVEIYKLTSEGKFMKDYNLKDQLRRSSISVPSNIAEGFGRSNNKEFIHFLRIARASCLECITQVIIGYEIGYLSLRDKEVFANKYEDLAVKIAKFITYLKRPKLIMNKE